MTVRFINGDCRHVLVTLPAESVHCVVTSPPYWGLRDYGVSGQIGLEPTIAEYVAEMVAVFAEVRRVLRPDGTLWLNLGDCYAGGGRGGHDGLSNRADSSGVPPQGAGNRLPRSITSDGLKPKDLCGIPWKVAQALQAPHYTGRIKAERDRVWLAAIIDGEGTICGFTHERKDDGRVRTGANVFVTNSCDAMLAECARIWPAARYEHMMPSDGHIGTKPVHRWVPNGAEDKALLLAEILPYLVSKKQQAIVAWNLLQFVQDGKSLGRGALGDRVREQRAALAALLSDLNQGRPYVLPSWLKEPPSLYEPGWYLRSEIIWHKPNPMPESVTDRPTKSHEQIFLLTKSARYFYDAEAIKEESAPPTGGRQIAALKGDDRYVDGDFKDYHGDRTNKFQAYQPSNRNKRSVWTVATAPFSEAHFATFPPELIEPCIKAGCPKGGTVLDPFGGAGTTGLVADRLQRDAILIELNSQYAAMARRRVSNDSPLFADTSE